jgi:hypothetical protein
MGWGFLVDGNRGRSSADGRRAPTTSTILLVPINVIGFIAVHLSIKKADTRLTVRIAILLIVVSTLMPTAGNQPHAGERQGAASDELTGIAARLALKVAV